MMPRARKALFLSSLVLVLGVGTARAESDERLLRLKQTLSLTPDQAKKIEAIFDADDAQAEKDKVAAGSDSAKLATLNKARKKKTDAQVDAVLTPEQKAKRDALKNDRIKKRKAEETAAPAPAPSHKPGGAKAHSASPAPSGAPSASPKASPAPSAKASPAPSAKPSPAPSPTPKP
jgi:hypothetical protein